MIFIVVLNPKLWENLKSVFASNSFWFSGHKNLCCVWDKFILGTSEQTTKKSKTSFAKIGLKCSFQVAIGWVFKYKNWLWQILKLEIFFPYLCLGVFHQNCPKVGFWTWIWSTRHCGLKHEVAFWFQGWKSSSCFAWTI